MTYLLAIAMAAIGFMITMQAYFTQDISLIAGGVLLELAAIAYVAAYARKV